MDRWHRKKAAKLSGDGTDESPSAVSEPADPNEDSPRELPGAYSVQQGAGPELQNPGFISQPHGQETPPPESTEAAAETGEGMELPFAAEVAENDSRRLRDEVRRIIAEEAVHAEEVVATQTGEDIENGTSKKEEAATVELRPFYKKRWFMGLVFVLVVAGIAVAVAVPLAMKSSDETGSASPVGCGNNPNNPDCFSPAADLHEMGVHGGNLTVKSREILDEWQCLEFCQDSFAARYSEDVVGDSCECYDSVDCLLPWGDQVDAINVVAIGTVFTKEAISTCTFDYCDVYPNDWFCFTNQKTDLRENNVYGGNLTVTKSREILDERQCLKFCQDSFAARYSENVYGHSCECYDSVDCLLPWGDQVDLNLVASGTLYTKEAINTCTFDYCDVYPNDSRCV